MICKRCRFAADLVAEQGVSRAGLAREHHAACAGCDCQHDVEGQLSGKVIQR